MSRCENCFSRPAKKFRDNTQWCIFCFKRRYKPNSLMNSPVRRKYKQIIVRQLVLQDGRCYYCNEKLYLWKEILPYYIQKIFNFCIVKSDCPFAEQYDGKTVVRFVTGDHIKPICKGGEIATKENIVACCEKCNGTKGAKDERG